MNLTDTEKDRLRNNGRAMIAFAEGKRIEWANRNNGDWSPCGSERFDTESFDFRPAPLPAPPASWDCAADVRLVCKEDMYPKAKKEGA